jgi:hypothetical protein
MNRLRTLLLSLILVLPVFGIRTLAQSASAVSATGHIVAEIIPVFSASETSQLNFGRFSPGPSGGKIILTPQNTISVQGTVFKGIGSFNAASFYLSGDVDAAFSISLPAEPVVLTNTASSKTMTVEDWNSAPPPGIGTGMLRDGMQTVFVGATLNVGTIHDNPVGVYTGSYTITFDFN